MGEPSSNPDLPVGETGLHREDASPAGGNVSGDRGRLQDHQPADVPTQGSLQDDGHGDGPVCYDDGGSIYSDKSRGRGTIQGYPRTAPRPPWREGVPSLRVGYDPTSGEWIIRAPGGHIIATTDSLEEVGRLVRHECDYGYGSVQLLVSGRHPDSTYTHHGLRQQSKPSPGGRAKRRADVDLRSLGLAPKLDIDLADLDL